MPRRIVVITSAFEADLDRQLPHDRTPGGTPSRLDYLLYELPLIIETFATQFDELFTVTGAPDTAHYLSEEGRLVKFYWVAGRLTADDVIELQMLELEPWPEE